jgi:hypothetical protein
MYKINYKHEIKQISGNAIVYTDGNNFTMGTLLIDVLVGAVDQIDGKEKLRRWEWAKQIRDDELVNNVPGSGWSVTDKDTELLLKLIADSKYGTLIVGPATDYIKSCFDSDDTPAKPEEDSDEAE